MRLLALLILLSVGAIALADGPPDGGGPPDGSMPPPRWQHDKTDAKADSKTEAAICAVCSADPKSQIDSVKEASKTMVKAVQEPEVSDEDMERHLKRQKQMILEKIRSSPCKMPGDDDDDGGGDSKDMMSMMGMGGSGGGPGGGKGVGGKSGSTMKMSLDDQDDIQEAMNRQEKKCQRQAKRQQRMSGGSLGMSSSPQVGIVPSVMNQGLGGGYSNLGSVGSASASGYGSTASLGSSYTPNYLPTYMMRASSPSTLYSPYGSSLRLNQIRLGGF